MPEQDNGVMETTKTYWTKKYNKFKEKYLTANPRATALLGVWGGSRKGGVRQTAESISARKKAIEEAAKE